MATRLLDAQRWNVRPLVRRYGLFRLLPIREYGPQPVAGDELVPAAALDKAVDALKQVVNARSTTGSEAAALFDVRQLAADTLKDLQS